MALTRELVLAYATKNGISMVEAKRRLVEDERRVYVGILRERAKAANSVEELKEAVLYLLDNL